MAGEQGRRNAIDVGGVQPGQIFIGGQCQRSLLLFSKGASQSEEGARPGSSVDAARERAICSGRSVQIVIAEFESLPREEDGGRDCRSDRVRWIKAEHTGGCGTHFIAEIQRNRVRSDVTPQFREAGSSLGCSSRDVFPQRLLDFRQSLLERGTGRERDAIQSVTNS